MVPGNVVGVASHNPYDSFYHHSTALACWLVFSFDPESGGGQRVVKLVIEKMNERAAAVASKKKSSDEVISSNGAPRGANGGDEDPDDSEDSFPDTPATQYAKQMPLLPLKLDSRASGLLAAWVQAAVVLVDALCRAEEM